MAPRARVNGPPPFERRNMAPFANAPPLERRNTARAIDMGGGGVVAGAGSGFLRSVLVVEVSAQLWETYAKRLALMLSQGEG